MSTDERMMLLALEEARLAFKEDEVPVGAVITNGASVVALAHNRTEAAKDPTAHAETLAIQIASRALVSWRLERCTLYSTMEPCAMCIGAAINARIGRVVFGAFDERQGCCGSVADLADHWFYHSIPVIGGVCEEQCKALLSAYFDGKRKK